MCLQLFEILLRNKSKIKLQDNFVVTSWEACKAVRNFNESGLKQLIKTSSLIFEYLTVDLFTDILNNLVENTVNIFDKINSSSSIKLYF